MPPVVAAFPSPTLALDALSRRRALCRNEGAPDLGDIWGCWAAASGTLRSLGDEGVVPPTLFNWSFRGLGRGFSADDVGSGLEGGGVFEEENLELMLLIHDGFLPRDGDVLGLMSRGL